MEAKPLNSKLTEEQKKIMFEQGTEAPFSGKFYTKGDDGIYHCANCGNPLFRTNEQFDSRCGWPSFTEPISDKSVVYKEDTTFGMVRKEVLCGNCGAHLGHVFDDGPGPSHQRYCINSAVFDFHKGEK